MHRFVVAKATSESANPSLMFKLEIAHQVLLHLVALPCYRCYFAIQVENAQQKILKKKKKTKFFFSLFSSMKSISSHFGGKRTKFFLQRNYFYENGRVVIQVMMYVASSIFVIIIIISRQIILLSYHFSRRTCQLHASTSLASACMLHHGLFINLLAYNLDTIANIQNILQLILLLNCYMQGVVHHVQATRIIQCSWCKVDMCII